MDWKIVNLETFERFGEGKEIWKPKIEKSLKRTLKESILLRLESFQGHKLELKEVEESTSQFRERRAE